MEIRAKGKYLRVSSKKLRQVIDLIRGLSVLEAQNQLKVIPKRAAKFVLKLLNSAIANAKTNFGLKEEDIYIEKIFANQGPSLKRFEPRAFGRAGPIKKRSSHLEIILNKTEISLTKISPRKTPLIKPEIAPPLKEIKPEEKIFKEKEAIERPSQPKSIFDIRRKGTRRTKQHLDKVGRKKKGGIIERVFRRKAV